MIKKIVYSNWINITGVFAAIYIYSFVTNLVASFSIAKALLSSIILLVLYGGILWIIFFAILLGMDILTFYFSRNRMGLNLLIECFVITIIYGYWVLKYQQYIFLAGIAAFIITQFIRYNKLIASYKK